MKEDLLGDLLKGRETEDSKIELMETGNDDKRKIAKLLVTKSATQQAPNILQDM